ncbi:MAG: sensor histidine kinase [Anaerotignaceae bacterium]
MIKTLQHKFISMAMVAVSILIIVMVGTINFFNIMINRAQTNNLIQYISSVQFKGENSPNRENHENQYMENKGKSASFFVATVDRNGKIFSINIDRISTVAYAEAEEMVENAVNSQKSSGSINGFKFQSVNKKNQVVLYIFLDNSQEVLSEIKISIISIVVGIICWVLMFLLVVLLSKKAIQPIAENIEKQKQFITDAGHEIKTPLAIIQANTDALELRMGESKYSKNIKSQVKRLSLLTHDMLLLAKNSESSVDIVKNDVDLSKLIYSVCNTFHALQMEKEIKVNMDIVENIIIEGNYELLEKLCSILIDNALKYAPQNSFVDVKLYQKEKYIFLTVGNVCEELPNCPSEKLFDRFYRGNTARTQKSGGFGIGLSSARTIVELHKGKINAEYIGENKICLTVKIVQKNK